MALTQIKEPYETLIRWQGGQPFAAMHVERTIVLEDGQEHSSQVGSALPLPLDDPIFGEIGSAALNRVTDLEALAIQANQQIAAMGECIADHESSAAALNEQVATQANRITALAGAAQALEGQLAEAGALAASRAGRIVELTTEKLALETQLSEAAKRATAQADRIDRLEAERTERRHHKRKITAA